MVASLSDLLALYPIPSALSKQVSTIDLYNLARTCRALHTHIKPGTHLFKALCRQSFCDGKGLEARKQFREPLYTQLYYGFVHTVMHDEAIEVRLFAQKCDEANALPCRRCGINICEGCRVWDREVNFLPIRPFAHMWEEAEHYYAPCLSFDEMTEKELRGQFLYEECGCVTYTRWLCFRCACEEDRASHMLNWKALDAWHAFENCDCREKQSGCGHDPELVFEGGPNYRKYRVEVFMAVQGVIMVCARSASGRSFANCTLLRAADVSLRKMGTQRNSHKVYMV